MPWIDCSKYNSKSYYSPVGNGMDIRGVVFAEDANSVDRALERRKTLIQEREQWLWNQKAFQNDRDFANAKLCSQMAAEAMKEYRAICWVIATIAASPPGDCKHWDVTPEMAPYIDREFGLVDLRTT